MTLREECLQELVQDGYMSEEEAQVAHTEGFIGGVMFALFLQALVWMVLL